MKKIKSKILLSFIFVLFISNVNAQDNESNFAEKRKSHNESFFKFGLKFGYDMYPLTYKPKEITEQLQNGYQAGVFLQMGYWFYFQPEVYYALYPDISSSISCQKIPTVRAPLMLGLKFLDLKILSFHLMGGPVLTARIADLQEEFTMDQFTYNWQVGVGIHILKFLRADVRYQIIRGINIKEQFMDIENYPLNVTLGIKL